MAAIVPMPRGRNTGVVAMEHAIIQLKRAHERYGEALDTARINRDRACQDVKVFEDEMNHFQRSMEDMEAAIIVLEVAAHRAARGGTPGSLETATPTAQKGEELYRPAFLRGF